MPPRSRSHHYLPRLYLKWFAASPSKKAKVQAYDLVDRKHFTPSVADIGAVRDFNTVKSEDGEPSDIVESFFSRVETDVAESVRKVIADPSSFAGIDKEWIVWLITCVGTRNPRIRGSIAKAMEELNYHMLEIAMGTPELYEETLKGIEADTGHPPPDIPFERAQQMLRDREFTISMGNNFHVSQELRMLEEIHGVLMRRNWRFLRASEDTGGFVSGDHPVVLAWTDPERAGLFGAGPGFASSGSTIYFPLSPQLTLEGIMEEFDDSGSVIDINLEGVAIVNNNVIGAAQRQVYAPHTRFRYFVRKGGDWVISSAARLLDDWPKDQAQD